MSVQKISLSRRHLVGAAIAGIATPGGWRVLGVAAQDGAVTPAAATSGLQPDGTWQFVDDLGKTLSFPTTPTRVVAQTTAAAALWDCGFKVVGVVGPNRLADGTNDFQASDIDFDTVTVVGDYGADSLEIDMEKLVGLQPELIVDLTYSGVYWYLEGVKDVVGQIAPMAGISMEKVSILDAIKRFEELAQALGADLSAPAYVEAITNFDTVEADLKAAIAEKPGLKVLVIAPDVTQVYVGTPDWMVDLNYFRSLGLDLVAHTTDNFFELLSWEQINRYPADLILVDARNPQLQPEQLATEVPTWNALPAVQAGQVGAWYAAAPYSRKRLIPIMEELTELIRRCRADVV